MAEEKETLTESDDSLSNETLEDLLNEEKEKQVPEEKEEQNLENQDFQKRYPQFQGDTPDAYLKQLEDAYYNSSIEGQRLAATVKERDAEMQVIQKLVQDDPALKKIYTDRLYGGPAEDEFMLDELSPKKLKQIMREVVQEEIPKAVSNIPAIKNMEVEKEGKDRAAYQQFESEHPEILTNPALARDLQDTFGALAAMEARNGRVPEFTSTLLKAWNAVAGSTMAEGAWKAQAQKESASMSGTSSGTGKSSEKRSLTPAEREVAKKLNLTDAAYLEGKELQKE
jgi:hypothetical protein